MDDTIEAESPYARPGASIPPETAPRLAGRYQILGLLGTGGMGAVYRVRDTELGEVVALKMLHDDRVADGEALERFREEVRLARRVTHRNVARTFDIGEHGGARFLTMELVDGTSLEALLAQRGPLPPAEVVRFTESICAGLAAAHAAGVIHRDLKPENVLVGRDRRVVVTDFGIARAHVDGGDRPAAHRIIGTPGYMAPEQIRGDAPLDRLVDVYGLGAVIYKMLTGQSAWTGETPMAVLTAVLSAAGPPDPRRVAPHVSDAMALVVLRAMAHARAERFPTVEEVASAMRLAERAPGPAEVAFARTVDALAAPPLAFARAPIARRPGAKTVAVLPLKNLGASADDYVVDGITGDLIDTLSTTRGLRVRPQNLVAHLRGDVDALAAGRELGVHAIVHGTAARDAGAVKVRLRLTGTSDGFQLWARRFEAPVGDLLTAIDDAAVAIAEALATDLPAPERAPDPAATDLYLRARFELRRTWHSKASGAAELFERALALAPSDARVLTGCATAYVRMFFFGEGDSALVRTRATELTERAVLVAPEHGDAWGALASFRLNLGDFEGAARALRSGVARAPSSATLEDMLGRILVEAGAVDEGRMRLEIALDFDPTLITARMELARAHALDGDWARSDAILTRLVRDDPHPAIDAYRSRLALWRGGAAPFTATTPDTYTGVLCEVLTTGKVSREHRDFLRRRAEVATARFRPFTLQLSAEVFAFAGEVDAAFDAVSQAVDAGLIDVAWMDRCSLLSPLRSDPRWSAVREPVAARADRVLAALRD